MALVRRRRGQQPALARDLLEESPLGIREPRVARDLLAAAFAHHLEQLRHDALDLPIDAMVDAVAMGLQNPALRVMVDSAARNSSSVNVPARTSSLMRQTPDRNGSRFSTAIM